MKGSVIKTIRVRRQDCFGDCGKQVLLRFNADGLCRKCKRSLRRGALRTDRRRERGTL